MKNDKERNYRKANGMPGGADSASFGRGGGNAGFQKTVSIQHEIKRCFSSEDKND